MIGVKELANLLGVSPKTVYAMAEEQRIPSYRIGVGRGTLRFDPDEVCKALRHHRPARCEPLPSSSGKHLL